MTHHPGLAWAGGLPQAAVSANTGTVPGKLGWWVTLKQAPCFCSEQDEVEPCGLANGIYQDECGFGVGVIGSGEDQWGHRGASHQGTIPNPSWHTVSSWSTTVVPWRGSPAEPLNKAFCSLTDDSPWESCHLGSAMPKRTGSSSSSRGSQTKATPDLQVISKQTPKQCH